MRILKVDEKEYRIKEVDYWALLERFNIDNAKEDCINKRCICPRSSVYNCGTCCLGPGALNCLSLMKKITGKRQPSNLDFNVLTIRWNKSSKASWKYIDTIYQTLLSLERVR